MLVFVGARRSNACCSAIVWRLSACAWPSLPCSWAAVRHAPGNVGRLRQAAAAGQHAFIKTFNQYRDVLFGANRIIVVLHAKQGDIWNKEGADQAVRPDPDPVLHAWR
jgi:hypothetical protein